MNDDSYGSTVREAMKASMSEPVGMGVRERRGWWRRNGAWVGLVAWTIAGILFGCIVIFSFDCAEGFFR
jgi:hypothetical protein